MEPYWWCAIVGIALVIAELITGTFYLLVIGIAALVGALAAYLNYSFGIQAVTAAAIKRHETWCHAARAQADLERTNQERSGRLGRTNCS